MTRSRAPFRSVKIHAELFDARNWMSPVFGRFGFTAARSRSAITGDQVLTRRPYWR